MVTLISAVKTHYISSHNFSYVFNFLLTSKEKISAFNSWTHVSETM